MSDYAIGPDVTASPPAPQGAVALLRKAANASAFVLQYADADRLRALADAIEQITPARIDLVRLIALHEDERSADRGTPFYATRAAQLRDVADLLAALRGDTP